MKQSTAPVLSEDLQQDLGEVNPRHDPRDVAAHDLELRRIGSGAEPLEPQLALLDHRRVIPFQLDADLPVGVIERDRQRPQLQVRIEGRSTAFNTFG